MDFGSRVSFDDASIGKQGLDDARSGPSDEEEGVRPVTTGVGVGLVTTGGNEGMSEGRATDNESGTGSTIGEGRRLSCLLTRDLRDRSTNGPEALSLLAGRLDGSPKSVRALNG